MGACNIPQDIVVEILSRIPAKSLLRFKSVCKLWYTLISDPYFINLHSHRSPRYNIMLSRRDGSVSDYHCRLSFLDSGWPPRYILKWKAKMCSEICSVACSNGLLLQCSISCRDGMFVYRSSKIPLDENLEGNLHWWVGEKLEKDLYLFNPTTSEKLELPKSIMHYKILYGCGFGFDPLSKEYKVVKIFTYNRGKLAGGFCLGCEVFSQGLNAWRLIGETTWVPSQITDVTGVFANGFLYWRIFHAIGFPILSFSLIDEKFGFEPFPPDRSNSMPFPLAQLAGCLCAPIAFENRLELWLLKDGTSHVWTKGYCIDKQCPIWYWDYFLSIAMTPGGEILLKNGHTLFFYDPQSKGLRQVYKFDDGRVELYAHVETLVPLGKR